MKHYDPRTDNALPESQRLLWAEICDALVDLHIEVPSRHFKGVLVGAHEAQVLTERHLEFCRHLLSMLEKETGVTKNENSNGGLGPQ